MYMYIYKGVFSLLKACLGVMRVGMWYKEYEEDFGILFSES